MKQIKLSILVPMYNVEEYLPLCLESILNQSFKNFECILINDGSTDNTLEIAENIAKKDKRFRIINKKNTGYGASLNKAIKEAKGEYIGIVEPDDFIHRDFYSELLAHDSDIIKCGVMYFYGKTWKTNPERIFHEIKEIKKEGIKISSRITKKGTDLIPKDNKQIFLVDPTIWSAVYKKELIENNKIEFLETPGASYQDAGFQFKTFASAKSIYVFEKPLYYYRKDNDKSSVKSENKIFAVKDEFDSVDKFIDKDFSEIADICRFRSYNWNLNRLKFTSAIKFAKAAKKDYLLKNFNTNLFKTEKISRSNELAISSKHPVLYVYLKPFFKAKNLILSMVYKTYRTIKK